MSYIELYNQDILDATSLGKMTNEFNESNGDYIKIEIVADTGAVLYTLYSNRLLMKYVDIDAFYVGDYHYHPTNGFMVGSDHTSDNHASIIPIPIGQDISNSLNFNFKYKKQFNIYYDDTDQIYIKPPEIIKQLTNDSGTFKFRIHFLRDIKASIGKFFDSQKNNLIENGNFFAGLEATQTGDLDHSKGLNRFTRKQNPSEGRFVLEQNGAGDNEYSMNITGIESNSNYIFSSWVAYDNKYEGDYSFIDFDSASTLSMSDETNETDESGLSSNQFQIELKGQYFQGWPHCKIKVNNVLVSDFYVESNQYQYYTFNLPNLQGIVPETELTIGVTFDNDSYGGTGGFDRNLHVRKIKTPAGNILTFSTNPTEASNGLINGPDNSSVLYYNLPQYGGEPRNTHSDANFTGEFRQNMAWNGEIKTTLYAGDFINFDDTITPEDSNSTYGLITTPGTPQYTTDIFSSYPIAAASNDVSGNSLLRNLSTRTVGGLIWYKKFKLVSTTPEADLGSIKAHLGRTDNPNLSSNTTGRRYFTDLKFEKLPDLNESLINYLTNLGTI